MTSIGPALRQHRELHGLTQEQLAARLDCGQGLLARWEQGKGLPSGANAVAIARELGWNLEQLAEALKDQKASDAPQLAHGDLPARTAEG